VWTRAKATEKREFSAVAFVAGIAVVTVELMLYLSRRVVS